MSFYYFFFKQKTSYEIYQCDWSSDVCSSDLPPSVRGVRFARTVDDVPDIPFGFSLPGAQPPDPSDPQLMQQFMAQLQQMFAGPGSGPVNWDLARQVAASQLSATGDPAVNMFERHQVEEALRL